MVYKLGAGGWRVGPTCDAPRTCKERARYLILRAKRGALEKHMKKKRRPLEKQNKKKKEPSEKKNKAPKVSNMEALASERVAHEEKHEGHRPVLRKALRGGISKSIIQRPCQFLATNAHKMAPTTTLECPHEGPSVVLSRCWPRVMFRTL